MDQSTRKGLVRADVGPVRLAYRRRGAGPRTVVFIHGSLDDHHTWDAVVAQLDDHPTLVFDRRGHGASTDVMGQGSITGDIDDVAALLDTLQIEQPVVVGHSYGACIAIGLAARDPRRLDGLYLHEPPLFALLAESDGDMLADVQRHMRRAAELAETGKVEAGVRHFVEHVAFGPRSWTEQFDAADRTKLIAHVDTWLDQARDPDRLAVDVRALRDAELDVVLSTGSDTLPAFAAVADRIGEVLPRAACVRIDGAAHGAPRTHPAAVAAAIRSGLLR